MEVVNQVWIEEHQYLYLFAYFHHHHTLFKKIGKFELGILSIHSWSRLLFRPEILEDFCCHLLNSRRRRFNATSPDRILQMTAELFKKSESKKWFDTISDIKPPLEIFQKSPKLWWMYLALSEALSSACLLSIWDVYHSSVGLNNSSYSSMPLKPSL